jgi:leader peptidase (prepilin peptidase)/N-methyltransferase
MVVVLALRVRDDLLIPALAVVVVVGVLLARIDVAVRRLPFAITVPAFAVTVVLLIPAAVFDGRQLAFRALGSAAGWLAFYGAIAALTRGRGLGWGDVVLAPTLGLVLGAIGWAASLVGIVAGFWFAALTATGLLVAGKANRRCGLAFGPFMLAGAALAAIAGDAIAGAVAGWAGAV